MRKITLLISLLFLVPFLYAQTTLSAGDIAFVGISTDGATDDKDSFAFVLLKDIDAATKITFTDRGWNDNSGFIESSRDGAFLWISGIDRVAGEVVILTFENLVPSVATFSTSGDQLFAIQGSIETPVFIAGMQLNNASTSTDANWDGAATSNTTSALPDALITGDTAVRLSPEQDNWQFSCGVATCPLTGSASDIRVIIHNPANWISNNDSVFPDTIDGSFGALIGATTNTSPEIKSISTISVEENQTIAIDVEATDDIDTEGSGLSYRIASGVDQSLFNINTVTGMVTFKTVPDFENPLDDGTDNIYNITVTATDSGNLTASQNIAITVTDIIERLVCAVSITAQPQSITICEDEKRLEFTVVATGNGTLSYNWQALGNGFTEWTAVEEQDGTASLVLSDPIDMTASGLQYRVIITDDQGTSEVNDDCLISSNAAIVTVKSKPVPVLPLSVSYNEGNSSGAVLDAGTGFDSYLWSNGETTQTITVLEGVYTVTVTNSNGCVGISESSTVSKTNSTLIITEIMYNPSGSDGVWEWIEVYNNGDTLIDLTGYVLDDNTGAGYATSNINGGIIKAQESAILYNSSLAETDFKGAWGDVTLIPVIDFPSLGNSSGDTIGIWSSFLSYDDDNKEQLYVVEQVDYKNDKDGWPNDNGKSSIYLTDLSLDNQIGANWGLSSVDGITPLNIGYTSVNVNGNSGADVGSPGVLVAVDTENPVAVCQAITVVLDANGIAIISANDIDGGSTDNEEVATLAISADTFSEENIGENQVTLIVTDAAGNIDECIALVTVEAAPDTENPVAVCQNITVVLDANGIAIISANDIDGGSTDNEEVATLAISADTFSEENIGENQVTLIVTDAAGNIDECIATVTVEAAPDTENPVAVCQNITVVLDASGTATIIANDIDGGSTDNEAVATLAISADTFSEENIGENQVALIVTDTSGNTDECIATVTVEAAPDTENPVAVCQNITVVLDANGIAIISANDIDGGSTDNEEVATLAISADTFSEENIGENQVTLIVTDAAGNIDECIALVTVEAAPDTENPVAVCQNITVVLDASGTATIIANDIDGGSTDNEAVAILAISADTFSEENIGENQVALIVTDTSGNTDECIATVTVETAPDTENPVAVCQAITVVLDANGTATIIANDIDGGSTDNEEVATLAISADTFSEENIGENQVTLIVTDAAGNIDECIALVTVEAAPDTENPVAVCQNITVVLDASGTATIIANDIDGGSTDNEAVAILAISADTFSEENIGENQVTLIVTDTSGNTDECIATVTVEAAPDTENPVAVCQAITVVLDANGTATITANDIDGGSTDNEAVVTLAISADTFSEENIGENQVTLIVTDTSGNIDECIATVTVETAPDTENPVAVCQNITVVLDANGTAIITANEIDGGSTDNEVVATLAISADTFSEENIGENQVTLIVTDAAGNTDECIAMVMVEAAPIITCLDNLANEDSLLVLPTGTWVAGVDSVEGTSTDANDSSCALMVTNIDAEQPWGRYHISIDLVSAGIVAGDEIFIGVDGKSLDGIARFEVNRDNTPNAALGYQTFGTSWSRYETTFTIPYGLTTIDLWFFSNYTQQTGGSAVYDNLVVRKVDVSNRNCPNYLANEDSSLVLPTGTWVGGVDTVDGTSSEVNGSICALMVSNIDAEQPWGRYHISIDLASSGIVAGDEIFIGVDGKSLDGIARFEVNKDNTPNAALGYQTFGTSWSRYETTFTIPYGLTTIDLWFFSNYTQQTAGSAVYDNLVVRTIKRVDGNCPSDLANEDVSIILPPGTLIGGVDGVVGSSSETIDSSCAILVFNTDAAQPWGRYHISIDLASAGIVAGDEIFIGVDGKSLDGIARFEVNRDNTPNVSLGYQTFGTSWSRYETKFTVPSGLTTIDLWFFSNYTQQTAGSAVYDNLIVSKLNGGALSGLRLQQEAAPVNELSLYPNPANLETTLSFDQPTTVSTIQVYDVTGRLVRTMHGGLVGEGGVQMNVQEMPAGTYFVKTIDTSGESFQQQMLIERY